MAKEILVMKSRTPLTQNSEVGDTRTPRREQTRQVLLDAAAKLFAERGYHNATVPNIVRAAGVSQGTFYQYFNSRRDVLVALTLFARESSRSKPGLRGSNFADIMREDINWYLIEHMRYTTLSKVWHDATAHDPEIAAMVRTAQLERAKELAALIATAKSSSALDANIAAIAVVAMIEEFTFRWLVDHGGPPRTTTEVLAAAETLTCLIARALGLQAAGGDE